MIKMKRGKEYVYDSITKFDAESATEILHINTCKVMSVDTMLWP